MFGEEKKKALCWSLICACSFRSRLFRSRLFRSRLLLFVQVTSERLSQNDIDQEIKECAVSTMGGLVAHFADVECLTDRVSADIWSLLQTRLRNEVTRIATLNALRRIANSPLNTNMGSQYLQDTVECLASFMRQQMRTLKLTTLVTTDAVVQKWGRDISDLGYSSLIQHVGGLIHERDLHMSHLALQVAVSCLSSDGTNDSISSNIQQHVLQPALSLAGSSLLQEGPTLTSLLSLLQLVVSSSSTQTSSDELRGMLVQPIEKQGNVPRSTILCVSKCVATVCNGTKDQTATINTFLNTVRTHQTTNQTNGNSSSSSSSGSSISAQEKVAVQLALHCIGEIGSTVDLSNHKDLSTIVLNAIQSKTDEVRSAAAFCLGSMSVGNMNVFVPQIIAALSSSDHSQYQLLTSIKEMVTRHVSNRTLNFGPYMNKILPVLQTSAIHEEEAVRNMVAECFGELASLDPTVVLPTVQEMTTSEDAGARWTAMSSLKYAVANPETSSDLAKSMSAYLSLLNDKNLNVKRAALLSLNAIIHHQSGIIKEHLNSIINELYESTKIVLVRIIDLGPFKHKVDDGLPLRKAAFSCMDSILDELKNHVDIKLFIPVVVNGLTDTNVDVKMLNHQLLVKLCKVAPSEIMSSLSEILPVLDKAVTKKVKTAEVGTQAERGNDGKKLGVFVCVLCLCLLTMTQFFKQCLQSFEVHFMLFVRLNQCQHLLNLVYLMNTKNNG